MLLSRFLRERRNVAFAWGTNDCMLFAADAVYAMTGTDPAVRWRGYDSKDAAETIIRDTGGVNRLITEGLGVEPHQNPLRARRGDVVAMELPGGWTAGVVDDTGQRIVSVTEEGITRLPLKLAAFIWSY